MKEQQNVDEATPASSGATLPRKLQWQQRCVLGVMGCAMRLWLRTLRMHIRAEEQALIDQSLTPVICVLWHNRIFVSPEFFRRFVPERKASAIISASNDGAWLAGMFDQLGIKPIRGSRHGRAMQAFRDMLRANREGYDLGVTPDGSRGPMYEMKAGAATVALRTGAPIILMSYNFSRAWRLKSWDRLYIPMPFSRVEVRLDRIEGGKHLAGGDSEQAVVLLRQRLMAITEDDEYSEV